MHALIKTVFPHFVALKRSIVQFSVENDKNLSYICTKSPKMIDFAWKFFDISLIEKIEAPSLIEAPVSNKSPPKEQSKNRSPGAYIRINTVSGNRLSEKTA